MRTATIVDTAVGSGCWRRARKGLLPPPQPTIDDGQQDDTTGPGTPKMTLSHHEQLALERIAIELAAEDPQLATTLASTGWANNRWPKRMVAVVMFVTGAAMLTFAILIPPSITGGILAVSVLGYLVMFAAALLWCQGPSRRHRRIQFPTRGTWWL